MKKFLYFITLISFSFLHSQELKDFTIPKGYEKIMETKGDLDKDGKDETVIVFNTDKTPDSESPGLVRKSYILKNVNGKLRALYFW